MTRRVWIIAVLSVTAVTAAFCFWQARRENGVLQTRMTALGRGATRLVSENADLREAVRLAREDQEALQTELATTRENLAQELGQKIVRESPITPEVIQSWLGEANDPAVMRRLNLQARYQTLRQYADLFDQLKLDPAREA